MAGERKDKTFIKKKGKKYKVLLTLGQLIICFLFCF